MCLSLHLTVLAALLLLDPAARAGRLAGPQGGDSSGVSVTTTVLSLVASLCWTTHGLALALPAVALPSLAGAVCAAWTLALLRPPAGAAPGTGAQPAPRTARLTRTHGSG